MSRGKSSNTALYYANIINLKSDSKERVKIKVTPAWDESLSPIEEDWVEGNIISLKFVDKEYKGKAYKALRIILDDNKESYMFTLKMGNMVRALINHLLNINEKFGSIRISVYEKGGYKNISVFNDGIYTGRKYTYDELKAATSEIKNPKGEKLSTDYSILDERLMEDVVTKICPLINKSAAAFEQNKADNSYVSTDKYENSSNEHVEDMPDTELPKNDDLPF